MRFATTRSCRISSRSLMAVFLRSVADILPGNTAAATIILGARLASKYASSSRIMKPFFDALGLAALLAASSSLSGRAAEPTQDVLTYHADAARSGNFVIPGLTFDRARAAHPDAGFEASIAGHVYAQPLFWRGSGGNGLLLVATESNNVYALDGASGKTVWQRALGRPASRGALPCGNIDPLGITGAPAIEPRGQALYLDAMVWGNGNPTHQ